MNHIKLDPERSLATIDRNIFGGFAEHLGRCIYGGIYDPDSPHADENGLRKDVLAALKRLRMPLMRYPGGNFASGYRWRDGVGARNERPARMELAWNTVESNEFGTDEFIQFCRALGTEPYLTVNCGDGDMREARDWVEYCNGTQRTALANLRRKHGFDAPHAVKYWSVGNEVDGPWQIGFKTPQEYARAYTEFAKVMRWTDPTIKLVAAATSHWGANDFVERAQLLLEQAPEHIDYLAIHWYVGNKENDFAKYMALSELFEERLSAFEGIIRAMRLERGIKKPIHIAVDEWNTWYRTAVPQPLDATSSSPQAVLEEHYNLEDALMTAIQLNSFIRHARSVRMANLAQIVNVIAPITTRKDSLLLETIYFPFELYSRECGQTALDVWWDSDTFGESHSVVPNPPTAATEGVPPSPHSSIRLLDVTATLDAKKKKLAVFVVNRSQDKSLETKLSLTTGQFAGKLTSYTINGPDIKALNTFERPNAVRTRKANHTAKGKNYTHIFEPHSVTALVCGLA